MLSQVLSVSLENGVGKCRGCVGVEQGEEEANDVFPESDEFPGDSEGDEGECPEWEGDFDQVWYDFVNEKINCHDNGTEDVLWLLGN